MRGILIVLRHPFADLRSRHPHDRVKGGFVAGILPEYLDAQGPFLYFVYFPGQSVFYNEAQEVGKPLAVAQIRTCQKALQLFTDCFLGCFARFLAVPAMQRSYRSPARGSHFNLSHSKFSTFLRRRT